YQRGNVVPAVGLLLIPASVVGGIVGSWVAQQVDPTLLRTGFGLFLLYGGARMLSPQLGRRLLHRAGPGAGAGGPPTRPRSGRGSRGAGRRRGSWCAGRS